MVAYIIVYDSTNTCTPPSDTVPWNALNGASGHQVAGGETQLFAFWKIAGASESASYTFTLDPGGYTEYMIENA